VPETTPASKIPLGKAIREGGKRGTGRQDRKNRDSGQGEEGGWSRNALHYEKKKKQEAAKEANVLVRENGSLTCLIAGEEVDRVCG